MQKSFFDQQKKSDRNTEFSDLLVIQKDMKDIFRKLVRQDIRFKKSLEQSHNKFYQKIFKEKRALIYDEEEIEFVNDFSKQIKKKRYKNSAPISIEVKRNQKKEEQKNQQQYSQNINKPEEKQQNENQQSQTIKAKQSSISTSIKPKQSRIQDDFSKGSDNNVMLKALYDIFQEDNEQLGKFTGGKANDKRVKSDEEIKEELHRENIETLLFDDVVSNMKQYEFIKLIQNPKVLEDVAHKIYERDPLRIQDQQHFKQSLKYADKALFMQFRDEIITYDQLLARVEERRYGTHYQVLDDLKGKIDSRFITDDKDDVVVQRALEYAKKNSLNENERSFIAEKRCVRSLFTKIDKREKHLSNSMDIIMKESHRKEVKENKISQEQQRQYDIIESYNVRQMRHASAEEKLKKLRQEENTEFNTNGITLNREEEAKQRQKKFTYRLKKNLKDYFFKYKSQLVKQTPQTSDNEVKFIENYLRQDISRKKQDDIQQLEQGNNQQQSNRGISKQLLIKKRRLQEIEQRKKKQQEVLFINRLVEDGQNVLTEQRTKIMTNFSTMISKKINEMVQKEKTKELYKLMMQQQKDKNNARMSTRMTQNSVLSTAIPQEYNSQASNMEDYPNINQRNSTIFQSKLKQNSLFSDRPKSLFTQRSQMKQNQQQLRVHNHSQNLDVSDDFKKWYNFHIGRHQQTTGRRFLNIRKGSQGPGGAYDNQSESQDTASLYRQNHHRINSATYAHSPSSGLMSPKTSNQGESDYKTNAIISRLAKARIHDFQLDIDQIYGDEGKFEEGNRPKTVHKNRLRSSDIIKQYQQEFIIENVDKI